jgi:hypothetical protein
MYRFADDHIDINHNPNACWLSTSSRTIFLLTVTATMTMIMTLEAWYHYYSIVLGSIKALIVQVDLLWVAI